MNEDAAPPGADDFDPAALDADEKATRREALRKIAVADHLTKKIWNHEDEAERLRAEARRILDHVDPLLAAKSLAALERDQENRYIPRCFSLQDLFDNPPAPIGFKVDGLIQDNGITGLIGRPKIGKSFLLQLLGFCVAGEVDFLGRKTRSGGLLYLDEEMGEPVWWSRYLAMRAAHPNFNTPKTRARYHVVALGGFCIDKPEEIRREIEKAEPSLLVVDSFRRIFRGQENDSAEIAKAMALFGQVRTEYRIPIVVSHHTRKNLEGSEFWEDAARGSSDFFAACDGLLGLGKRGKGLAELRGTLRAAKEPDSTNLALNEQTLIWEVTTRQPESSVAVDSFKAIEEILLSKPEHRWPQKLVGQALQTQFGRSDKQAEKALAQVPLFNRGEQPPLEIRLFKWPIPGTHNEREVILAGAAP